MCDRAQAGRAGWLGYESLSCSLLAGAQLGALLRFLSAVLCLALPLYSTRSDPTLTLAQGVRPGGGRAAAARRGRAAAGGGAGSLAHRGAAGGAADHTAGVLGEGGLRMHTALGSELAKPKHAFTACQLPHMVGCSVPHGLCVNWHAHLQHAKCTFISHPAASMCAPSCTSWHTVRCAPTPLLRRPPCSAHSTRSGSTSAKRSSALVTWSCGEWRRSSRCLPALCSCTSEWAVWRCVVCGGGGVGCGGRVGGR